VSVCLLQTESSGNGDRNFESWQEFEGDYGICRDGCNYNRVPVLRSALQGHNLLNKCALRKFWIHSVNIHQICDFTLGLWGYNRKWQDCIRGCLWQRQSQSRRCRYFAIVFESAFTEVAYVSKWRLLLFAWIRCLDEFEVWRCCLWWRNELQVWNFPE